VSAQAAAAPAALRRAAGWAGVAHARLLSVRPRYVVATLVAAQWAALAALAVTVRHNGWVYYMGGDQLWHYTGAYLLAHRELAPTYVGVGWTTILTPVAWIAGRNLVSALPFIILFNGLVLVPLATFCMYGIGSRIGGRVFGYWTALLWIVLPYVGIPYALHGYHQKYTELTLPQVLGLGAMADFPSVVALIVGAYLCLRALDDRHWAWAAGAGFAVGYALAIKPSNTAFLIAPAALFLAYRWRAAIFFAAGLAPPIALLAYWKARGFGRIPAFSRSEPEHRIAAGSGIFHPLTKYTHNNTWTQLHNNLIQLREVFWSDRLLEFLAVAGMIALLIRSRRAGVFVVAWFVAFLLLKGTYINARVEDGGFWRLLLPAFPAFVVLLASVPLLVPGVRLHARPPTPLRAPRRAVAGALAALGVVLVLFPFALVASAKPIRPPHLAALQSSSTLLPVESMGFFATPEPNGILLQWRPEHSAAGGIFYRIYRTAGEGGSTCVVNTNGPDACGRTVGDTVCGTVIKSAPTNCFLSPAAIVRATTRDAAFLDRPAPGTWTYRIGLTVNWLNDEQFGDPYVFSEPATVTVG
jgi:hypothetical protein